MKRSTAEKFLMVANWKMNPVTKDEAKRVAQEIKKGTSKHSHVDVVMCPSFIHMAYIAPLQKESFFLGAQTSSWTEQESLTGEVSPVQLRDFETKYCLVGHSERRTYGETDYIVSKKIEALLKRNITPILCIGEKTRDDKGEYLNIIQNQLRDSLQNIPKKSVEKIVVAYEPIWAIGAEGGRSARGEEIQEIAILIRRTISDMYDFQKLPQNIILYGGSVGHKREIEEIVIRGGVNGCLVGRASLSAKTFVPLVEELNRLANIPI